VKIYWNPNSPDSEETVYNFAWLRDNRCCPLCVDPSSGQKMFNREHVIKVFPKRVHSNPENTRITIDWNDDHQTVFSPDWLHKHSLSPKARKKTN